LIQKLLLIAAAGGLGAIARFALGGLVQAATRGEFPWGTVTVNVLGCFLFGLLWAAMENRVSIADEARVIVLVGFMGSFTTFSTFAFDTAQLLRDSAWLPAIGNLVLQNVVGLMALIGGITSGRLV